MCTKSTVQTLVEGTLVRRVRSEHSWGATPRALIAISTHAKPQSQLCDCSTCGMRGRFLIAPRGAAAKANLAREKRRDACERHRIRQHSTVIRARDGPRPVFSDPPGRTPTSLVPRRTGLLGLCLSARHRELCARLELEDLDDGLERRLGLYYLLLAEEEVLADLFLATAGVVLAERGPVSSRSFSRVSFKRASGQGNGQQNTRGKFLFFFLDKWPSC